MFFIKSIEVTAGGFWIKKKKITHLKDITFRLVKNDFGKK